MKSPKLKSKSAITGKYVSAKSAKAKPATTYKSDDYPARMLRRLIRLLEAPAFEMGVQERLIANIKRRMGWR